MVLKRLTKNDLEKHLQELNALGFVDVVKNITTKLINEESETITYHEVRYVHDKLKEM